MRKMRDIINYKNQRRAFQMPNMYLVNPVTLQVETLKADESGYYHGVRNMWGTRSQLPTTWTFECPIQAEEYARSIV